jgi:DNA-binding NtrC family response regulator/predicted hydrocarbon binding protein
MLARELRLDELLDISAGRLDFQGRRLVLHSVNAFAQLRKDLLESVGPETARRIFTRFGYFSGQADAAAMKRLFTWDTPLELLRAGPALHTMMGVVRAHFESLEADPEAKTFRAVITWRDSGEAEEHLAAIGKSEEPVCWMLTGYASGFATFCLGFNVYFRETACVAKGDAVCLGEGRDGNSWGDELDAIRPFFHASDIRGSVRDLTEALKRKTRELERQKVKLSNLEHAKTVGYVEVHSKSFQKSLDVAYRVARFDSSVLIVGETGAGKEVLARYIHHNSTRSQGKFVAINCASLPETLLESELFGHKAGSFTGAVRDRIGLFEEANNGTIFLDEIGDISPAMQTRLLRVLQEHEVVRVGENLPRKITSRVISATHRDLAKEVAEGRFREDLYYRIRIIEIDVPPLRDRVDDILPLARFFIGKLSKKLKIAGLRLDATSVDYLLTYPWPGNVRELENILERAAILAGDGVIRPEHLPFSMTQGAGTAERVRVDPLSVTLEELELSHIREVLHICGGNKAKAAKALGISAATMWRKLKE